MEGPHRGPGMSIFQGSEQLQVDTDTQRELEEEAAADQQRRDAELQRLLTNAFDDLYDDNDNESTISSIAASDQTSHDGGEKPDTVADRYHAAIFGSPESEPRYILEGDPDSAFHNGKGMIRTHSASAMETYMNNRNLADTMSHKLQDMADADSPSVSALHYQHCFRTSPGNVGAGDGPQADANEQYRQTSYNSMEQLQVLYDVRVREVKHLSDELEQLKNTATHDKDQLLRKLAFSEAEKDRAQLMYKQVQGLLVESKEKVSDLGKKVMTLEATVDSLQKSKADLSTKLEASQTTVDTLHHKILILERGSVENTDKHMDAFLRNVQSMHNQQIKKLEDELDLAVAKLSKKELELEQYKQESERRLQQLEARLVEKGDTVNQLARSLEDSQRQCQQLMGSGSGKEAVQLRLHLDRAEQDRGALQAQLQIAKKEVQMLQTDLKQYEAVVQDSLLHDKHMGEGSSAPLTGASGAHSDLQEPAQLLLQTNKKLRDELRRALLGQKEKREELSQVTSELDRHKDKVSILKRQEQQSQAQIKKLEEESATLREKVKRNAVAEEAVVGEELHRQLEEQQGLCAELQAQLAEEEKERRALELAFLQQEQLADELAEEVAALKKRLDREPVAKEPSEEYLKFHEKAVAQALQDRDKQHKMVLDSLSAELEKTQEECNTVKELYISTCTKKEEFFKSLQEEQNKTKDLEAHIQKLVEELKTIKEENRSQTIKHEAALIKLKAQTEKLQQERKALADTQALTSQLVSEKAKAKNLESQNKLFLEKLHEGKENLEAAERVIAEGVSLKAELNAQNAKLKSLEERYEMDMKRLESVKEQAVKEAVENAKAVYTEQVTKEIERVQKEGMLQIKQSIQEEQENETIHKLRKLQEEYKNLQDKYRNVVQRHEHDTMQLIEQLDRMKEELKVVAQQKNQLSQALHEKEEQLCKLRPTSRSSTQSGEISDDDKVPRGVIAACEEKLKTMKTGYELQLQKKAELVRDETMQFCIQQMRQNESKHLEKLRNCKEIYEKKVSALQVELGKAKTMLGVHQEKLEQMQKAQLSENNGLKVKEMEERMKYGELKAQQIEKELETTKAKYSAAKKAVHKYKKYTEAQKKHMEKEWQRINAGFQQVLFQVQQKLSHLLDKEEAARIGKQMEELKFLKNNVGK